MSCSAPCTSCPEPLRVAITGAAGQICYSLLFRIASGEVFGCCQPVIIHMLEYDAPSCIAAAEGVAMELTDSAFPLLRDVVITADPMVGFKDIDYAILVGAAPRKAGMTRADLLAVNGKVFEVQGKAIDAVAKKSVRVWVVGNPANTNCLICAHNAPTIPRENFVAMTRLDHNRTIGQLCKKIPGISAKQVYKVCVFGNHSPTMVPCIDHGHVVCSKDGKDYPILGCLEKCAGLGAEGVVEYLPEFFQTIKTRGSAIIKARGFSSAASAANAIVRGVRDWHLGTREGDFVSMGLLTDVTKGAYGIGPGICYSFPCVCKDGKWEIVELPVSDAVKAGMAASEAELREERTAAGLE